MFSFQSCHHYTSSNTAPDCIVQEVKLQNFLGEDPQNPVVQIIYPIFISTLPYAGSFSALCIDYFSDYFLLLRI